VVILGQTLYHGEGQAAWLSFFSEPNVKIPRRDEIIYKRMNMDLGYYAGGSMVYLLPWAGKQGVLLAKTVF